MAVLTGRVHQARMASRQRLAVVLLLGTSFMLSIDFSIMNVALPALGVSVGLKASELPWVISAYALPAAGFSLLFGRLADLFGRRRMFLTGVALLIAASLAGGFAPDAGLLLSARTLHGFATAIASPAALSLLITSFDDERRRARVLGLNGTLLASGFTVGALAGGALVGGLGWRWAFLINVPVAVVILTATPFLVPASRAPGGVRLDVPGAVTVTAGLLTFAFGVINRNPAVLLAGLAMLVVFLLIERRAQAPLAAARILARPTVKWGNLGGLVTLSVESGLIFLMTLYLQDVLHLAPLTTGLVFGVPGLASVVAGVIAGRLIGRHGARKVLAAGLVTQAAFTAPLALLGTGRMWLAVLVPVLFFGFFGHVTSIVAYTVAATSGLPDFDQGLATGLTTMTLQVSSTIGAPILSAIAASRPILLPGLHLAVIISVAAILIIAAFIWTGLRPRPQPTVTAARHRADSQARTGAQRQEPSAIGTGRRVREESTYR
jgi:MFS family permease